MVNESNDTLTSPLNQNYYDYSNHLATNPQQQRPMYYHNNLYSQKVTGDYFSPNFQYPAHQPSLNSAYHIQNDLNVNNPNPTNPPSINQQQINDQITTNYDHSQKINASSPKVYTLKFKSNKSFNPIYKDYFYLKDYLTKIKPESDISAAFFNKNDELIIKTNNPDKIDNLRNWPKDAFNFGLTEIAKKNKFYLALHNVDINFNIESQKSKKLLAEKYFIDDLVRMFKKSTGEKLQVVKAHAACSKSCPDIMKETKKKEERKEERIKKQLNSEKRIIYSGQNSSNLGSFNTINLLKFIIELIRNLRNVSSAIHTDPSPIIKLIQENFGSHVNFVSLNETFLKTSQNISIPNYQIFRSDRIGKAGGGSALCIKKSIKGKEIDTSNFEETTGFETILNQNIEIAIFSIYSSPSSNLNENFFDYVAEKFKYFIIIGDLNVKHHNWSCNTTNQKGKILDKIISKHNLFVLNNSDPTFKRGGSVIDLSICSANLTKYFKSFRVLKEEISDHEPTLTYFKDFKIETKTFEKINWKKLKSLLCSCPDDSREIQKPSDFDFVVAKLTSDCTNSSRSITIKVNNQLKTDDSDLISNIFADNLESIFSTDESVRELDNQVLSPTLIEDNDTDSSITGSELLESLNKLNSKAASGFDRISNKILKNLPNNKILQILKIFNSSLKFGYIPDLWNKTKIIMIIKKDKPPDEISSFRPISLQNCIVKWLEKIINNKVQLWAENEKLFPECQSGFRQKRSFQDHIFRINQSIVNGFNKKQMTGAIFFDLEKAFDKTSHT
ncbi:RNA-directed DNA polymerase from transposon X, partial [Brachionus plicatilis]